MIISTSALTFNGVTLSPISHKNQTWLSAAELSKALGYAKSDAVSQVYDRNSDEFNDSMTTVLRDTQIEGLGKNSGLQKEQRIFSLRGCHLIAMFAKTVIAKQFRVWVLDILDKEVNPKPYGLKELPVICPFANQSQSTPVTAPAVELITNQQRVKLEDIVSKILSCVHFESSAKWNIYASIREMYKIESIDKLPARHFDAVHSNLSVVYELAKQHHNLLCEADKNFIKSVMKKQQFQLPPQQYGLLA
jgi:prophage antirepressor-like protein